ncbi:MAG TPA: PIG-L family deacetylase [Dermatophilaceae bacterium]|nr:PIG-L family deacetylase [Dermatophilaceae bacterium]
MKPQTERRRMLFVHAHPDDETLATGVALASYAHAGHDVHVLTCTLGEEGEIIPAELAHLAAAVEDRLGAHRRRELTAAMSRLGVSLHVLGDTGPPSYRDSGMAGTASAAHPQAFCMADLGRVATQVRHQVRLIRPDLVVTYEDRGGYRHPDHIRTHQAVVAALIGMPPQHRPELFAVVTPHSWAVEDRAWVRTHCRPGEDQDLLLPPNEPFPPSVVADDLVTHAVIGTPEDLAARDAALREHRTQVTVRQGCYTLSNRILARLAIREGYLRWDPVSGRPAGRPAGDVVSFAGISGASVQDGPFGARPARSDSRTGLLDEAQPEPARGSSSQEGPR